MEDIRFLPESTQVLYSQLLDELVHSAYSSRGISFIKRTVNNQNYWYLQFVVGSSKRSFYIGVDDDPLRQKIESAKALWQQDSPSAAQRARLVTMLRAGGAITLPNSHGRILEAMEQSGVFVLGGVVIGSHAFALMGNSLGVQWNQAIMRTQDIDVAHDNQIFITVPDTSVDLQRTLEQADKAFFPVPALNRKHPSTTFSIRGSELSVSLLTPLYGKPDATPIKIGPLNAMANPLRFLDYLLEEIQPAAVPIRHGVLVNIPSPARFALHKLVVSQRRPAAFHTKAQKDIIQAQQVLQVLLDTRPGDILFAIDAAKAMPPKFMQQLQAGINHLDCTIQEQLQTYL